MSQIIQTPAELMQYIQTPDAENLLRYQVMTRNQNFTPVGLLTGIFGHIGVVGTKPFQPTRAARFSGLLHQQKTIIDTDNTTHYREDHEFHGFVLPPVPYDIVSSITADSIGKRWYKGRDGLMINPSPDDRIIEIGQNMTDMRNFSTEIWLFLALKYGFNPSLKDIDANDPAIFTEFNSMNFLNAWGEQRPTGAQYKIVDGATVDFSVAGNLQKYAENIIDTLRKRAKASKTPIAVKNGAVVLCGYDFFRAIQDSPDFIQEMKNPSQHYAKVNLNDVQLPYGQNENEIMQKIYYRGVYFINTEWNVVVGRKSFDLIQDQESLVLPVMDQTITDMVEFYTSSVDSSSVDGVPGPVVYSDMKANKTSITVGVRGQLGVINKYPEIAMIHGLK